MRRFTASKILQGMLLCGIIVAASTTRAAQNSKQNSTPTNPQTNPAPIDPRSISLVLLAEGRPRGS
jgi:hypothetical protein